MSSTSSIRYKLIDEESIRQSISEGQKLALFIGRRPYEALPQESGITWISMDPGLETIHPPSTFDRSPDDWQRLHIQMAFCEKTAAKLKHIFNKVVVDLSTYKFFDGTDAEIIPNLVLLLKPDHDTTLTFSNSPDSVYWNESVIRTKQQIYMNQGAEELIYGFFNNKDLSLFQKIGQEIPGLATDDQSFNELKAYFLTEAPYRSSSELRTDTEERYERFLQNLKEYYKRRLGSFSLYELRRLSALFGPTPEESHKKWQKQVKTIDMLKQYFAIVQSHRDTFYPYQSRYDFGHTSYFTAKGKLPTP